MAIFLAGSDEVLIVIGSQPDKLLVMLEIIGIKVVFGTGGTG